MTQLAGCARYIEIEGFAIIIAVGEPEPDDYICPNDPVKVLFDFHPTDPNARKRYRFPTWSDSRQSLTIGAGMNPPRKWVLEEGLTVGSKHRCIRQELDVNSLDKNMIRGSTPVVFVFPDINESRAMEVAYAR